MSGALQRWLTISLSLWGVGCLSIEALASAGMAATFVGAVAHVLTRPAGLRFRSAISAWWPLAAFVTWALLAPMLAGRAPTGTGIARVGDWVAVPFGAYAFTQLGASARRKVALACGVTFLASCGVAGFQHFGVWPSPDAFKGLEWTRYPFYRVYEAVPNAPGRFMAGGLHSHRLKFAHVGGLVVLFALALGLRQEGRWRVVGVGTALVGAASILWFPYARMASGALLASTVVAAGLSHPRRRLAAGLALGLAASAVLAISLYSPLRQRFVSALTFSGSGERTELLATGARAVREFPVAGCGLGRFRPEKFRLETTSELVRTNPGKAHNQILSVAAEVGIPGALLFLVLLVQLMRRMSPSAPNGAAGIAAGVFFLLLSFGHDPLYQAPFSMALALAFSAALATPRPETAPASSPPPTTSSTRPA